MKLQFKLFGGGGGFNDSIKNIFLENDIRRFFCLYQIMSSIFHFTLGQINSLY